MFGIFSLALLMLTMWKCPPVTSEEFDIIRQENTQQMRSRTLDDDQTGGHSRRNSTNSSQSGNSRTDSLPTLHSLHSARENVERSNPRVPDVEDGASRPVATNSSELLSSPSELKPKPGAASNEIAPREFTLSSAASNSSSRPRSSTPARGTYADFVNDEGGRPSSSTSNSQSRRRPDFVISDGSRDLN